MFGTAKRPRAVPSAHPAAPVPTGPTGYVNGWAPFGNGQHATQQTGAFAGQQLNQYPVNIPGVQLSSGRNWGRSAWYYPSIFAIPNGSPQQTQQNANIAGGQRNGSTFRGGLGPLQQQGIMAGVTAQQVRQSGAQALGWARQLTGGQAYPPQPGVS